MAGISEPLPQRQTVAANVNAILARHLAPGLARLPKRKVAAVATVDERDGPREASVLTNIVLEQAE